VVAAIKGAQKNALSASGTGPGGAWHLAVAGLSKASGAPTDQIKYIRARAAPLPCRNWPPASSASSAYRRSSPRRWPTPARSRSSRSWMQAGWRACRTCPTLKEATGLDWQFVNWFALTLPKGVPANVRATIAEIARRRMPAPTFRTP
jgi:tripartite-type tricarboxylate transporter receptor subunit TctC